MSRPPLPADQTAFRPTRAKPRPEFQSGRPKCPAYFTAEARAEWKRVVGLLAARGTLTKADAPSLELYCQTYASWRKCQEEIQRDGPVTEIVVLDSSGEPHTVRKQSEASKLAAKLANGMRALLKELGSTPASREKATPARGGFKDSEPPRPGTVGWMLAEHKAREKEEQNDSTDRSRNRNDEVSSETGAPVTGI